jgi:hypothetical protein
LKQKKSPLKRELANEEVITASMNKSATILINTKAATVAGIAIINRTMRKNARKLLR